jgi:hypothetical protein
MARVAGPTQGARHPEIVAALDFEELATRSVDKLLGFLRSGLDDSETLVLFPSVVVASSTDEAMGSPRSLPDAPGGGGDRVVKQTASRRLSVGGAPLPQRESSVAASDFSVLAHVLHTNDAICDLLVSTKWQHSPTSRELPPSAARSSIGVTKGVESTSLVDFLAPDLRALPSSVAATRRVIAGVELVARQCALRSLAWRDCSMRLFEDLAKQTRASERALEKERMRFEAELDRMLHERESSLRKRADETLHHVKTDAKREIQIARKAAQRESEQTVQRVLAETGESVVASAARGRAQETYFTLAEVTAIKEASHEELLEAFAARDSERAGRLLNEGRLVKCRRALRGVLSSLGLGCGPSAPCSNLDEFPPCWSGVLVSKEQEPVEAVFMGGSSSSVRDGVQAVSHVLWGLGDHPAEEESVRALSDAVLEAIVGKVTRKTTLDLEQTRQSMQELINERDLQIRKLRAELTSAAESHAEAVKELQLGRSALEEENKRLVEDSLLSAEIQAELTAARRRAETQLKECRATIATLEAEAFMEREAKQREAKQREAKQRDVERGPCQEAKVASTLRVECPTCQCILVGELQPLGGEVEFLLHHCAPPAKAPDPKKQQMPDLVSGGSGSASKKQQMPDLVGGGSGSASKKQQMPDLVGSSGSRLDTGALPAMAVPDLVGNSGPRLDTGALPAMAVPDLVGNSGPRLDTSVLPPLRKDATRSSPKAQSGGPSLSPSPHTVVRSDGAAPRGSMLQPVLERNTEDSSTHEMSDRDPPSDPVGIVETAFADDPLLSSLDRVAGAMLGDDWGVDDPYTGGHSPSSYSGSRKSSLPGQELNRRPSDDMTDRRHRPSRTSQSSSSRGRSSSRPLAAQDGSMPFIMSSSIEVGAEADATPSRGRARTLDTSGRARNPPTTPGSTRSRRLPRLHSSDTDSSLPELSRTPGPQQAFGSLLSRQRGGRQQQLMPEGSPALQVVSRKHRR